MFDFIKQNPLLWLFVFLVIVSPSLLVGAFQVIAIVMLIIVALVMVGLLVLRWKVRKIQKEMGANGQRAYSSYSTNNQGYTQQNSQQNNQQNNQQNKRRRRSSNDDVDVKIFASMNEKRVADDVGDYVEFEEVKDSDK